MDLVEQSPDSKTTMKKRNQIGKIGLRISKLMIERPNNCESKYIQILH